MTDRKSTDFKDTKPNSKGDYEYEHDHQRCCFRYPNPLVAWIRGCFAFQPGSSGHHLAILSQLTIPIPGRYWLAGSALDSRPLDLGNILATLAPLTFGVESRRRHGVCILPLETEALSNATIPEGKVIDCIYQALG